MKIVSRKLVSCIPLLNIGKYLKILSNIDHYCIIYYNIRHYSPKSNYPLQFFKTSNISGRFLLFWNFLAVLTLTLTFTSSRPRGALASKNDIHAMKQILYVMGPLTLGKWLVLRALKVEWPFGQGSKLDRVPCPSPKNWKNKCVLNDC